MYVIFNSKQVLRGPELGMYEYGCNYMPPACYEVHLSVTNMKLFFSGEGVGQTTTEKKKMKHPCADT